MLRMVMVLGALALGALGVRGLVTADPSSGTDFLAAGIALVGAIVLIGLAFVLGGGSDAAEPPVVGDTGRAEVIERLQRHTEALRRAEQAVGGVPETAPPLSADAGPAGTSGEDAGERPPSARPPEPAPAAAPPPEPAGAGTVPAQTGTGPDAVAGGRFPVRLPALMLLNVAASAGAADIESAPPLGARADVLARLRDIVPDLEMDGQGRARHAGPDHAIRLDLGAGEEVHTVVVDAAGRTGISLVRWFLESTGWRAFAPKLGQFVDPDGLDALAIRED